MAAAGAGAAHPHQQAVTAGPQVRQDGAVDPLGAEDVDVVQVGELLGGERLDRAEDHVPGVVHHDVQAPLLGADRGDRRVDRGLILDVHLDAPDVDRLGRRQLGQLFGRLGVAVGGGPHPGVDRVTRPAERPGGEVAEAAGGAGDDDDHGRPTSHGGRRH